MRESVEYLLRLELWLVGKCFAPLYPVAEIDIGQFEDLCQFDLIEQGVGTQREFAVIRVVVEVDGTDAVIEDIDEVDPTSLPSTM